MIRTLIALALLATPALADTTHQCNDGSTLTVRGGSRPDVVIKRAGEIDIAIPYRVRNGNGTLWTPRTRAPVMMCDGSTAPCAMEKHGEGGPYLWYILDGPQVFCRI